MTAHTTSQEKAIADCCVLIANARSAPGWHGADRVIRAQLINEGWLAQAVDAAFDRIGKAKK